VLITSRDVSSVSISTSTDEDYYMFALPTGIRLNGTITMDILAAGDLDMEWQNSSGSLIASSTETSNIEQITINTPIASGVTIYYLRVYGYNGATAPYKLNLNLNTQWDTTPPPRDTVGLLDPQTYTWYLNNKLDGSMNIMSFRTPIVPSWWIPITGDWDGDGDDTVGLYDPSSSTWYLNNSSNGSLSSLITFRTPAVPSSWVPLAGDWNGDGRDSVGLYDPVNSRWYLNNRIDGSINDLVVVQTPLVPRSWRPLIGDWNGDGRDTIGLFDPLNSRWYLNDRIDGTITALTQFTTPAPANWIPLAGDWDSDGRDSVALYDPLRSTFYLNNRTDGTITDLIVLQVPNSIPSSWKPLVGNWDGLPLSSPTGVLGASSGEGESRAFLTSDGSASLSLPREDVNRDGAVTPLDVLHVINALNRTARADTTSSQVASSSTVPSGNRIDVDGDGILTPRDALTVINSFWASMDREVFTDSNNEEDELLTLLSENVALQTTSIQSSLPVKTELSRMRSR